MQNLMDSEFLKSLVNEITPENHAGAIESSQFPWAHVPETFFSCLVQTGAIKGVNGIDQLLTNLDPALTEKYHLDIRTVVKEIVSDPESFPALNGKLRVGTVQGSDIKVFFSLHDIRIFIIRILLMEPPA